MTGRRATTDVRPGRLVLSVGAPDRNAPPGWRWVALSEVATMATGHTPSRKHPEYWGGDIPWMNVGDARPFHGRVIHETSETTNSLGIENSAAVVLPQGTVCLSRTGSIGYAVILGRPMATSQGFVNWICSPELLPEFLQQIFLAEQSFLHEISEGVAHTTIYFPEAKAFHVCIPRVEHQRRIVAEVEKQFSRLEEAVANLKRVKANLDRYAASVLDATTAGGLVEESVERARSWQQTTLGAVADVIDPNPSHRMPAYVGEGFPLISSENFVGSEGIDFTKGKKVAEVTLRKQRDLFRIESGDFALSRIGTIGKTRFLPIDRAYCLSHALVVIKVKTQEVDKRWLRYAVSSSRVLSQARGGVQSVGVPDLGMGKIRAFEIPLPPLEVQQSIAAEVDRRLSIVREVESEVGANLTRASALRQAVLARAFD